MLFVCGFASPSASFLSAAQVLNVAFRSQPFPQAKCENNTGTWNLAEAEAEVAGGKRKRALQHLRTIIDTLPKQRPGTAASRAARDAAEVDGLPDDDKPYKRARAPRPRLVDLTETAASDGAPQAKSKSTAGAKRKRDEPCDDDLLLELLAEADEADEASAKQSAQAKKKPKAKKAKQQSPAGQAKAKGKTPGAKGKGKGKGKTPVKGAGAPRAATPMAQSSGDGGAVISPSNNAGSDGEWLKTGNAFIGRVIRRATLGDNGATDGAADARVVGWLPADKADFVNDAGEAAALWRVRYTAGDLAGDEEDLEEFEVKEAILAWNTAHKPAPDKVGSLDVNSWCWDGVAFCCLRSSRSRY